MLLWDEIAERFGSAQHWWIGTAGSAGPHAAPIWGVVVNGALIFYGAPNAVRSRNISGDSRIVLHLNDPVDVLILHGTAADAGPVDGRREVTAAYAAKYPDDGDAEWLPGSPMLEGVRLWAVGPTHAIAWRSGSSDDWVNRRWRSPS